MHSGFEFRVIAVVLLLTLSAHAGEPTTQTLNPDKISDPAIRNEFQKARAGDVESQLKIGRRFKDGDGFDSDPKAALQWFLKAAAKGNAEAQWEVVDAFTDGNGTAANEKAAVPWLSKLVASGDLKAHERLAKLSPSNYVAVAKQYPLDVLRKDDSLQGKPVFIEGRILEKNEDTWRLKVLGKGKDTEDIKVDASRLTNSSLKEDTVARFYGAIAKDPLIDCYLATVPPPKFEWSYRFEQHGVGAWQDQAHTVYVTIRNTGKQKISSMHLAVRMYQVSSPNDETQDLKLKDLKPGEVREETVTFSFFNYAWRGGTSIPKVEVKFVDLEQ